MEEVQFEDYSYRICTSIMFLEGDKKDYLSRLFKSSKKKTKKSDYDEEWYNVFVYQNLPFPPDSDYDDAFKRFEKYFNPPNKSEERIFDVA